MENVDDVLKALGGFGRFQGLILFMILFMEIPCSFLIYIPVFIGVAPNEWMCGNETVSKFDACSCKENVTAIDSTFSVVAEWDLICGSSWVSDSVVSLQMLGMVLGNIVAPILSDWYGRRYCFLGIICQAALGSIVTAVAPNAYVYATARLISGASYSAFISIMSVYTMEFLTPTWRPFPAAVNPTGEALMLLGLLAYFIRPWRDLMWATIVPFAAMIVFFPFLPESPRWLLRNGKFEEAHAVFNKIAKINGRKPVDIETLKRVAENEKPASVKDDDAPTKRFSYLDFFRHSKIRKTTLCLQALWFSWGLVYFGISYNIKNLPGNPYLNVFFLGLTDAIGNPLSLLVNKWLGRRKSVVAFMTLSAVFLVTMAIVQLVVEIEMYAALLAALCFLGKFGSAGARSVARTLTAESYPTTIRTMGISLSSGSTPLGAIIAPQIAFLGTFWPSVPFFVFAVMSIGGSLVSFLLEETDGTPMLEVVDGKNNPASLNRKESKNIEFNLKVMEEGNEKGI